MIAKLLVAFAAPFLLSAAEPRDPRTINAGTAPAKYHGDNIQVVIFVNLNELQVICGNDAPAGLYYAGCTGERDGVPIIVVPNPCASDAQEYAHIVCHELSHRNGWNSTHDN